MSGSRVTPAHNSPRCRGVNGGRHFSGKSLTSPSSKPLGASSATVERRNIVEGKGVGDLPRNGLLPGWPRSGPWTWSCGVRHRIPSSAARLHSNEAGMSLMRKSLQIYVRKLALHQAHGPESGWLFQAAGAASNRRAPNEAGMLFK